MAASIAIQPARLRAVDLVKTWTKRASRGP